MSQLADIKASVPFSESQTQLFVANTAQALRNQLNQTENTIQQGLVSTNQNIADAYKMTSAYKQKQQQQEKSISSDVDLNAWFSSFATESPEDAKALSTSLSKFARYVQSMTDKGKTPQ